MASNWFAIYDVIHRRRTIPPGVLFVIKNPHKDVFQFEIFEPHEVFSYDVSVESVLLYDSEDEPYKMTFFINIDFINMVQESIAYRFVVKRKPPVANVFITNGRRIFIVFMKYTKARWDRHFGYFQRSFPNEDSLGV